LYIQAAINKDNPEIIRANDLNIQTIERSTLLGEIMRKYKYSIGVSGTHGKTTTTSMISSILLSANYDPTITVGGEVDLIGGNLRIGNSEYFVTEACEYVESFLKFHPYIGVILNVDEDHLDYFKDINHITTAFITTQKLIPQMDF
jgi:UDP-N-acetylmuramate--alanine ligase